MSTTTTSAKKATAETPKAAPPAASATAAPAATAPKAAAVPKAAAEPKAASAPAAAPPAQASGPSASTGTSSAATVEVRTEVATTVTKLAAEAAKAATQPKAKAPGAELSKEAVKKEKPKAESKAAGTTKVPVMPAQVPSPSVFGVASSPATVTSMATQEAAPGAEATFRQRPAVSSMSPAEPVPRIAATQSVGAPPGSATTGKLVAEAASKAAAAQAVPVPPRAVEVVSRAPAKAVVGLPPTATPVPAAVPPVSVATALTAAAQPAIKAATPPSTAAPAPSAPTVPVVPKSGPPALAAGRAAARGACPAVNIQKGKPVVPIAKRYQIVFVSSEVAPWSKTGGLGEAMDGLPIALAALGHRVMTITPRYDQYKEAWDTGYWSSVSMGSTTERVHAFHAYQSKVDRVFLDHDCFLAKVPKKTGAMLYGPEWGQDFADNQWRFTYFAKAALKVMQELPLDGYPYGDKSIVIVNDWHSSLVPVYLAEAKKAEPERWAATKSALLIHNCVFQGRFDRDDPEEPADEIYDLPEAVLKTFTFNMPIKVGRTEPKVKRCLNWMAAGALYVDRILTVSPTYAWELLNLPEMGVELDDIFAAKGITGIVNGVKEGINPSNEAFTKKAMMPSTFSIKTVDAQKAKLKAYVQELYGLPESAETPLCVFVGRLDLQKGYDYLLAALTAVLDEVDLQVIIVGSGRSDLVAASKALAKKYPTKVYMAGWCGPERYAMVAAADYNLMPSRWEPCGLAQMESMRFGTLPVVAQTGGLVDTVEDMLTGIHLEGAVSVEKELDPSSVELMARSLERCSKLYADTQQISKMRKAAMVAGSEFTWANAALQYEAVCEEMGAKDVLPLCKSAYVTMETDKVVA